MLYPATLKVSDDPLRWPSRTSTVESLGRGIFFVSIGLQIRSSFTNVNQFSYSAWQELQALFTRYRITYVSDPFSYRIGVLFIRLCMNPISSAPTIRYKSAPHQQVVRKWTRYNPYCSDSGVNIVIRYEPLPNLALIVGWLQYKRKLIDCLANRQRKQQIWWT